MDYKAIQVDQTHKGIGIITLNRPDKRNALSIQMRREITACMESWKNNDNIGIVIITGAGIVFSAGFDLKEFSQPDLMKEIYETSSVYHKMVWYFPKPVIAAVNGMAFGGGFDLATLCDIRICSSSAIFAHPEIKFGAPPFYTPLRWIIGCGLARDLCFTGRRIDAMEAFRIGLVSEVVDDATLMDRAISTARTMLEAPLRTLMVAKDYITGNMGKGFDESFINEHDKVFEDAIKFLSPRE